MRKKGPRNVLNSICRAGKSAGTAKLGFEAICTEELAPATQTDRERERKRDEKWTCRECVKRSEAQKRD
jgi:hypothetical protein